MNKNPAMLGLSSRPWVCYNYLSKNYMVPLSYETLDYAASFNSTECREGIVGISSNTLRIITPGNDNYSNINNLFIIIYIKKNWVIYLIRQ